MAERSARNGTADQDGIAPALECRGLRKAYGRGHEFRLGDADGGVSFSVARGELFALLGPSGCGKTTTLRIIGGLTSADAGSVFVNGEDITRRPPYTRPTNTVFQSYALFPHLSVGANVAFGLASERLSRGTRRQRVADALATVGLAGFQDRHVSELSGGQQQRAALARAIVRRPAVLLLDEPLGALDLELRRQMQDELVRLKTSTDTTFVHVTHDQEEACAIADRIAVMRDGLIVQVDEPAILYQRPKNTYVARFLDAGTIIRGVNDRHGDVVDIAGAAMVVRAAASARFADGRLAAVLPAGRITFDHAVDATNPNQALGTVIRLTFTGDIFVAHVAVGDRFEVKVNLPAQSGDGRAGLPQVGSSVRLSWRPEDVILVADSDEP